MHVTHIGDDNMLLEPGDSLDPGIPDTYLIPLLQFLQEKSTRHLIYDMSNVAIIDGVYYDWLVALARLCTISGIEMIVVNMRPHTVYALALTLIAEPPFRCALDVDTARHLTGAGFTQTQHHGNTDAPHRATTASDSAGQLSDGDGS
jgi:hypothetical protein